MYLNLIHVKILNGNVILETVFTVLTYVITTMIAQTNLMNVPKKQIAVIQHLENAKNDSIDLRKIMNLNSIVHWLNALFDFESFCIWWMFRYIYINAMIGHLEFAKDEWIDLRYMMNLNAIVHWLNALGSIHIWRQIFG